ncbi:hypothetical protein ACFQ0M_42335 [Kitasatospora aburaviensis]
MDCEDVMLTVRITAAERALLRAARGHGGDVSEVAVDGLLDVIPALTGDTDALRLVRVLARPAPCAVTFWLPASVVELLPLVGDHVARLSGVQVGPASGALSAALRLWLAGDPARLAASSPPCTRRPPAGPVPARWASRPDRPDPAVSDRAGVPGQVGGLRRCAGSAGRGRRAGPGVTAAPAWGGGGPSGGPDGMSWAGNWLVRTLVTVFRRV